MLHKEKVSLPSKKHKINLVIIVTDRVFKRNLHSILYTYLRFKRRVTALQ